MLDRLSIVTRKGQVTLPVDIRQALGLKRGDRVAFVLDGAKCVTLHPVRSVAELTFGSITPRKRPEDFKELRRMAEDDIAQRAEPGKASDSTSN